MTSGQKIVKYFALALAAFLIVTIVGSIVMGLSVFSGILGLKNNEKNENMQFMEINNLVKNIELDLVSTKLQIIKSPEFNIETNNKKIKAYERNGKLELKEESGIFGSVFKDSKLVIYLPDAYYLDEIAIDSGAGTVEIESIKVGKFNLDIGAGNVEIEDIEVIQNSDISGGAGALKIKNSLINNLDLEVGVGRCEINSIITGNSTIEAGIGELKINLLDSLDNYLIRLEKGIGNISINNEKATNSTYGIGNNSLNIEAGIGNISITTAY